MAVVRGWLIGIGIAVAVLVATWGLLILLARRLPEGTAKELARFLPACGTTVRRLRARPAAARRAELGLRYTARRVPRAVLLEARPGDRRIIERLLGSSRREPDLP